MESRVYGSVRVQLYVLIQGLGPDRVWNLWDIARVVPGSRVDGLGLRVRVQDCGVMVTSKT